MLLLKGGCNVACSSTGPRTHTHSSTRRTLQPPCFVTQLLKCPYRRERLFLGGQTGFSAHVVGLGKKVPVRPWAAPVSEDPGPGLGASRRQREGEQEERRKQEKEPEENRRKCNRMEQRTSRVPGLEMARLWQRSWNRICSPHFHGRLRRHQALWDFIRLPVTKLLKLCRRGRCGAAPQGRQHNTKHDKKRE